MSVPRSDTETRSASFWSFNHCLLSFAPFLPRSLMISPFILSVAKCNVVFHYSAPPPLGLVSDITVLRSRRPGAAFRCRAMCTVFTLFTRLIAGWRRRPFAAAAPRQDSVKLVERLKTFRLIDVCQDKRFSPPSSERLFHQNWSCNNWSDDDQQEIKNTNNKCLQFKEFFGHIFKRWSWVCLSSILKFPHMDSHRWPINESID